MGHTILPDLSIVLFFLRSGQGWSQAALARAARTTSSLINDYEHGRKRLTRARLEQLVGAMGLPIERIDATLACLEANRAASRAPAGDVGSFAEARRRIEALAVYSGRVATDFVRSLLTLLTFEGEALHARQQAEALWDRLKRRTPAERVALVEDVRKYQTWALCERVASASIEAAANHPREALELARLALRIAERVPEEESFRRRLCGYSEGHIANGQRVCNDLPAAREAIGRAVRLWEEGAPGDPGLLNAAWLPWIEANIRRDDRDFPRALAKIDEALRLDGGELRGKILLSKAGIFDALGEPESSTAALLEAALLIDADREPRNAFGLLFQLLRDLCHLGRAAEAAQRLPEVRGLAEKLGEELDLTRVLWLEGKTAAGLGRVTEARACFEQVRRKFRSEKLGIDYALVSLDLAQLLLAQGYSSEVRALAEEMLWLFSAQAVHREALAALQLFCEAARKEVATADLAQRIALYLQRAQRDPMLPFEPNEGAGAS